MTVETDMQKEHTLEAYLAMEEMAEYKHEFHNGQIKTMTGANEMHNAICANLIFSFAQKIRMQEDSLFKLYTNDMKVWVPQKQSIVYPGALVISKPPIFYKRRNDILENPFLIAEVLSSHTQEFEKRAKFEYYKSIRSFQEYVAVSQEERKVSVLSKQTNGKWTEKNFNYNNQVILLPNIGFEILMEDIYYDITFY